MYNPEAFAETRRDVLLGAVAEIGLAAIVTPVDGDIAITHAPMVAREDNGVLTLETHFARANDHWKRAGPSAAIFQGPHAYVHPGWYASKAETGKVVPTWAYIVIHAHGRFETVQDETWLRRHLDRLTLAQKKGRAEPWAVTDAPARYIETLSRGIVGMRLTVDRLEGKWKVNQNKTEADRAGTRDGLAAAGPMGEALAKVLD